MLSCALDDKLGSREVLDADAVRLKDSHLVLVLASCARLADSGADTARECEQHHSRAGHDAAPPVGAGEDVLEQRARP